MSRRFTLTVAATSGHIHDVAVTVDGRVVLSADGSQSRTFACDELSEDTVTVRVSVTGAQGSQYTIGVDLPGEDEDFVWGYTLASNVQTVEFRV
jgi:hypothetical protein